MKKIIISLTLLTAIFTIVTTSFASGVCIQVDMAWIQTHVPVPPATIIEKTEVNGLCQVILKIQGQMVPVFAGKDFVVAGEMFQNKTQMTQNRIATLQAQGMEQHVKKLDGIASMTYAPKNANGKVAYMMTDPLCPYCNTAGDSLKSIADETGVTFKLVLANVHGAAGEAKIKEALCKKFSFDQYIEKEWKQTPAENNQCTEADTFWANSSKIVEELGLQGLPAFILQDGQVVTGANMPGLKGAIGKMKEIKSAQK